MNDFKIVDAVPVELQLVPLQRVAAAMSCSERTLLKRLGELSVPVTRLNRKTRGLTIADMARLLTKIQNHRPAGSALAGR